MKSNITLVCFVFFLIAAMLTGNDALAQKGGAAPKTDSVVFGFKTGPQFWKVPDGVTNVHVDVYGAQGGGKQGGKGGAVHSDVTMKAGDKFTIYVGAQPNGADAGENGGGKGCGKGTGGGGATDIRMGGLGLNKRILVAGGGGGFGYSGAGGLGGGLTGGNGTYIKGDEHIAAGGSQTTGGAGARAYGSVAGTLAVGGDGYNPRGQCSNNAMAGGGGGYYGGGGGGAGGGGGGSSYADTNVCTNVVHEQGVNEGNGKVVVTWVK